MEETKVVVVLIPNVGTMVAQECEDNPRGGMRLKNLARVTDSPTGHELQFAALAYYTPDTPIDMNLCPFLTYPAPPMVKNEYERYLQKLRAPHP